MKILLTLLLTVASFAAVKAQCSFTPTIIGADPTCTQQIYKLHTEAGNSNYQWTVTGGGGGIIYSAGQSDTVSVVFTSAGAKTISVSYTKSGCNASSAPKNLTIVNAPVATITANPTSGPGYCSGTVVTYTAPTGAGISDYKWIFPNPSGFPGGYAVATVQSGSLTSSSVTVQWNTTTDGAGFIILSYLDASQGGCRSYQQISVLVLKKYTTTVTGTSALCPGGGRVPSPPLMRMRFRVIFHGTSTEDSLMVPQPGRL